ncbi:MAG: 23S rRNA (guanosine(2251)-2'-O)-methyltransferase RlmB [Myxococcota bacterium]
MKRIIYGVHPVTELLRTNPASVIEVRYAENSAATAEMLELARAAHVRCQKMERHAISRYADTHEHQGVAATAGEYRYCDQSDILTAAGEAGEPPLIVALDNVQDPRNMGSIIRSAYLLGAHGVIFPKDRNTQVTAVVCKTSSGATEHIKLAPVTNLARALKELKDEGLWVVGTDMEEGRPHFQIDLKLPVVLVIGGEGEGMRNLTHKMCDFIATIPSRDAPFSFNASVAASLLLGEAWRQRH